MVLLRKFAKRFFILLNIVTGFFFLLACCNAFLHPDKWWFISLLAFLFPFFLIVLFAFLICWLFIRSRYALISLVCILLGWKNIHAFFGFSTSPHDFTHKDPSSIRVMTWNVMLLDEFSYKKPGETTNRISMLELIGKQNADILCLQEFYEHPDSIKSNIRYFRNQLHYPYYFFSRDYFNPRYKYETGAIIFSKYPIVGSTRTLLNSDTVPHTESLISADININGRLIRVFTAHLQSVLFSGRDYRNVEIVQHAEDSILEASRSLAKKLKSALGLRGYQADTVRRQLDKSPYPLIMCGDFNDVPNSYTYFHIRGKRQDAFIEKSAGIGRTYIHISPTLRIDYILPSEEFQVIQTMKLKTSYSDHNAVLTDLQLQDRKR